MKTKDFEMKGDETAALEIYRETRRNINLTGKGKYIEKYRIMKHSSSSEQITSNCSTKVKIGKYRSNYKYKTR